jgi:hypothetical protein
MGQLNRETVGFQGALATKLGLMYMSYVMEALNEIPGIEKSLYVNELAIYLQGTGRTDTDCP